MEKNNYVKPTMRVVELKHRTCLLVGSDSGATESDGPNNSGYIPGMSNDEMNKLA